MQHRSFNGIYRQGDIETEARAVAERLHRADLLARGGDGLLTTLHGTKYCSGANRISMGRDNPPLTVACNASVPGPAELKGKAYGEIQNYLG